MSRGFFGNSGGSKKTGGKSDKKSVSSLLATRGMSQAEMLKGAAATKQKDYKEMLEELIDENVLNQPE